MTKLQWYRKQLDNVVSAPAVLHMSPIPLYLFLQTVLGNLTVAELLLVSKTFVLDCWAAEEFALKNGRLVNMKAAVNVQHGQSIDLALPMFIPTA